MTVSPRAFVAALALCWAGAAFLWALQIVLPAWTFALWFVTVLAKEASFVVSAFALFGIVLALLALNSGARGAALISAALCAAAFSLSLVPATQALRTAAAERTPLSPATQFGQPSQAPAGQPETVAYSASGGETLRLDVHEPAVEGDAVDASGRRPAVIMVHGGGWGAGQRGLMPLWNEWFAGEGYVVFDIDYRLTPQSEWRAAPGDVKCAIGWVRENAAHHAVDPDRVAVVGYSAGGHLALLSAYSEGDGRLPAGCGFEDVGVSAVAAFYPPTNLTRLHHMDWPWAKPNVVGLHSARRFLGGTPEAFPGRYRLASPTTHVDSGDPPTFLVHGVADRVVPVGQSRLLRDRLREAGVSHRLLELPWANHSFDHASDLSWNGSGAQITRSALSGFLERHLAAEGEEPVGPAAETPADGG